jgi:hypothetical protein
VLDIDEKDFFAWVEVAVSDEGKEWRIIRDRAPIYRFEDDKTDSLTVSYPETRARWVRLRILDGDKRFPVRSCRVAKDEVDETDTLPVNLAMIATKDDSSSRDSLWEGDAEVGPVPLSAVQFEAKQEAFHRLLRISKSDDQKQWEEVGKGVIYRYRSEAESAHETLLQESLKVEFPEARGRYWRVRVSNRNDPPVEGLEPQLMATRRSLILRQEPGQSYWLLYGNPRAEAPGYDLEWITSRTDLNTAVRGDLGGEEVNTAHVSPEPWTEQHPLVLWLGLGVAVAVLGLLALRSLRQA